MLGDVLCSFVESLDRVSPGRLDDEKKARFARQYERLGRARSCDQVGHALDDALDVDAKRPPGQVFGLELTSDVMTMLRCGSGANLEELALDPRERAMLGDEGRDRFGRITAPAEPARFV